MAPRGFQHVLVALAALVWAPVCALGQIPEGTGEAPEAIDRPTSIGRIVRHFDFEEQSFNALDIPLYWIRAQHDPEVRQRPGFPITNLGRLDYTSPTTSGTGSVRLDTTGGSASLRLEPGVTPTFPSVKYAVGAMVRVRGLEHARPRLVARLLDDAGAPIPGTRTAALVEPGPTGWSEGFVPVLIKLPAAPERAVSLQIDLELAQPRQIGTPDPEPYELFGEDYAGTVWFDDVVVVQLPTASLSTTRASNTFLADQKPELLVRVRDLSGDPIDLDLRVRDVRGEVVAHRTERFVAGVREFGWSPDLPALGWYEAELLLRVGQTPMLRLRNSFAWLPGGKNAHLTLDHGGGAAPDRVSLVAQSDRQRLGLVSPPHGGDPLPEPAQEVLERSGARALLATVPLDPTSKTGAGEAPGSAWTALARRFTTLGTRLGVNSTAVIEIESADSAQTAERTGDGDQRLAALNDRALWDGVLVPMIDRLAEGVARWHMGPMGSDALATTPASVGHLEQIGQELHRLAPDPMVGAPWWGGFDPAAAGLPQNTARGSDEKPIDWSFTVLAPREADGPWIREISDKIDGLLAEGRASESIIVLEPLDEALFGRAAVVARLAEQMLAFWGALPQPESSTPGVAPPATLGLALAGAFHWRPATEHDDNADPGAGPKVPRVQATAQLAAWRAIGDRLIGRRRAHEFVTIDGVRAEVYRPVVSRGDGGGGLLVLYPPEPTPSGGPPAERLELYLGDKPVRVYDVFGNARGVSAEPVAGSAKGAGEGTGDESPRLAHRIELGDWPVFVEGVDVELLMFIASLRLEPAHLPAIDAEHRAALVMQNPWPGATNVRVRVVSPGGFGGLPVSERSWEISPRLTELLLEGGAERRTPINIRFRRREAAGRKNLGLELDIQGEHAARKVRVDVPFEIGLDYLSVTASARRTPEGLLVQAEVRNVGPRPVTLETTAIAPGARRERATIAHLPAGATARREMLLRGVDDTDRVLLAVEDIDAGGRLNYRVDVP